MRGTDVRFHLLCSYSLILKWWKYLDLVGGGFVLEFYLVGSFLKLGRGRRRMMTPVTMFIWQDEWAECRGGSNSYSVEM